MAYSHQTSGDPEIDRLITEHHDAVYDCGDWRDPLYERHFKYRNFEDAFAVAERTRVALYEALRQRLVKTDER